MSPVPFVSVNPDWSSGLGHFGAWEDRMNAFCRETGRQHWSLCHRDLDDPPDYAVPVFSSRYFPLASTDQVARFEQELRRALQRIGVTGTYVVGMYCGSLDTLAAFNVLATEFPDARFVLNLLRSHAELRRLPSTLSPHTARMVRISLGMSRRSGVRVAVDTAALARLASTNYRFSLEVWPMMLTTDPLLLQAHRTTGPTRIVAPIQPQIVKGFDLVGDLCARLRPEIESSRVELVARWTGPTDDVRIQEAADQIRDAGGVLVEGELSDAAYASLVSSADIIVAPYRRSVFHTRTSAVVLDAIAAGVPPIATSGTWAGELLERAGVGSTFRDGDPNDLYAAVTACVAELDAHRQAIDEVRQSIVAEHEPSQVLRFLDAAAFPAMTSTSERTITRQLAYEAYQTLDAAHDGRAAVGAAPSPQPASS